jgi:hypothetical protein
MIHRIPEHILDTTGYPNILPVKCPRCGVAAGAACVYTSGGLDKVGRPMKVTHDDRIYAIERRRATAGRRAETAAVAVPLDRNRLSVIEAERRAQMDEHAALHAWLREHGRILL